MFYDISNPRTEARIFSFFPLSNNVGMVFGPIIGGWLTSPVEHYPSVFGNFQIFSKYPYALPTMVGGFVIISGSVTTELVLKMVRVLQGSTNEFADNDI
jgi:MFS family permease